jgi:hypothetical protein
VDPSGLEKNRGTRAEMRATHAISGLKETQNDSFHPSSVGEEVGFDELTILIVSARSATALEANTNLPRRSTEPDVCSIWRQQLLFR